MRDPDFEQLKVINLEQGWILSSFVIQVYHSRSGDSSPFHFETAFRLVDHHLFTRELVADVR
jgi:hypothetical protein